VIKIFVSIIYM